MTERMKQALQKAKEETFEKFPSLYIESKVDPKKGIYAVSEALWDEAIKAFQDNLWNDDIEQCIRKKLESDFSQANNMINWASHSDKPFENDTELIMVEESANTIIKLIKKEIGV